MLYRDGRWRRTSRYSCQINPITMTSKTVNATSPKPCVYEKTVELVDDEEAKDDKRNRIGPELISKQTDDEEHLNNAVTEEIEGIEALGADGKILR